MSWSHTTLNDDVNTTYDHIFNQELSLEGELNKSKLRRQKAMKSINKSKKG